MSDVSDALSDEQHAKLTLVTDRILTMIGGLSK